MIEEDGQLHTLGLLEQLRPMRGPLEHVVRTLFPGRQTSQPVGQSEPARHSGEPTDPRRTLGSVLRQGIRVLRKHEPADI
jgi:hypothetical protein